MNRAIVALILFFFAISDAGAGNGDLLVDGNLGIGKDSPSGKIHVFANSPLIKIESSDTSGFSALTLMENGTYKGYLEQIGSNFYDPQRRDNLELINSSPTGSLTFHTNNTAIPRMTISVAGNVGIGTTTPASKLHVMANSPVIKVENNDSAGYSAMTFLENGQFVGFLEQIGSNFFDVQRRNNLELVNTSSTGNLTFHTNNSSIPRMIINSAGSVGIGTGTTNLDPLYKLTVAGDAYATGIWRSSDERYKQNIMPVHNALATLMKIDGVSYEWIQPEREPERATKFIDRNMIVEERAVDKFDAGKTAYPEGRHLGVLAQAIEKVLPEVVKTDSNGDKAVNYDGIIPILIEAIKEQQKTIEELKAEVAKLKK